MNLSWMDAYQENFDTVSYEQLSCFLEGFVPFKAYCFSKLEVFWLKTIPFTTQLCFFFCFFILILFFYNNSFISSLFLNKLNQIT